MPIEYQQNQAVLRDVVSVDDADGLLDWLQNNSSRKVNLVDCTHLHPANLQVLLAAGVDVTGWPQDPTLRTWLESVLTVD
jgi:hypothetical protein